MFWEGRLGNPSTRSLRSLTQDNSSVDEQGPDEINIGAALNHPRYAVGLRISEPSVQVGTSPKCPQTFRRLGIPYH